MKCIKVYPILKKTFSDSLTYWTSEDVEIGDIIEAPLQNRMIWVVIDSVLTVSEAKEFIKAQEYRIRKIEHKKKLELFSQEFVYSVLKTSNYFIKPFGEIFSELIPKRILNSISHDIKINSTLIEEIHIYPIQEYIENETIKSAILPIDLYKIDTFGVKKIYMHYSESEYYRHIFKKFDYRYFIREFCKRKKIVLQEIDTLLNLENKKLYIIGQSSNNKATLRKKNEQNETYKIKLNIISPELFSALKECEKSKKSILLYTLKKGFAPKTICPDCKHVVTCPNCYENVEIQLKNNTYFFSCKSNHTPIPIDTHCPICTNQNLLPLGASIEVIYNEIKNEFKNEIIRIDNENNTKNEVKKLLKRIEESEESIICIGNDFLINQCIKNKVVFDTMAIISLESVFAIPLYSMEKDIYNKISLLSKIITKNIIIQTRDVSRQFWTALKNNTIDPIINSQELEKLGLPPYRIHIQIKIPTEKSKKTLLNITSYLGSQHLFFEIEDKTSTTLHILIEKNNSSLSPLIQYLKTLPLYIKVEVDSRNLI